MIQGLPNRLRTLRQNYGMSQRSVAAQLDVSPSIVSGYESGERTPSAEMLLALSNLFRCSTDYLLGKENSYTDVVSLQKLTPARRQLILSLINELE